MKKPDFTPGPWTVYQEPTMIHQARILSHTKAHETIARSVGMSNAYLISTAPEMLWCLEHFVDLIFGEDADIESMVNAAYAAQEIIKKARREK